jgi:hypothetical protein
MRLSSGSVLRVRWHSRSIPVSPKRSLSDAEELGRATSGSGPCQVDIGGDGSKGGTSTSRSVNEGKEVAVSHEASVGKVEIPVTASNQPYLVQRRGDELVIGRKAGETVMWQDETVPVADLPTEAQRALTSGDTDSKELSIALEAIVQAFVQRGG